MRLREALVKSRNLVSIRIMHALGPAYVTNYVERFGFPEDTLPRNLTLALGTAQVSPLEMASAYSVFANGGYRIEPYYIDRIQGPDGNVVFEAAPKFVCRSCVGADGALVSGAAANFTPGATPGSADDAPIATGNSDERSWGGLDYLQPKMLAPESISAQNDFLMTDVMSDVIRRGTATRALQLQRGDISGKTGTTNDRRDAWFCGFNSSLVGTAWVGFDQERSLGPGEEGARTALPMWIYFMAEALKGVPEQRRTQPPGLVTMRVSADSGLAARPGDPNAIFETFMPGHLPAQSESDSNFTNADGTPTNEQNGDDSLF
jgi:penicillin-binding protein 1A